MAWSGNVGTAFREEYNHGFNLRPDPLGRLMWRVAQSMLNQRIISPIMRLLVQFFRVSCRRSTERLRCLTESDGRFTWLLGMLTALPETGNAALYVGGGAKRESAYPAGTGLPVV
jgi:hypothetical protein